jgi:hypothetical protein
MIAQGAMGLAQTVGGLFGRKKAREEFENMELPSILDSEAYKTAEMSANLAGRQAQEGLPEQTMRFQEDMISRSGAAALNTQGSLRGLQGVGGIATSLADQYRQLASMDAGQRVANRERYFAERRNVQGLEMQQADREYGQALNKQAAALARMTANQQNIQSGLGALSEAGSMAFSAGFIPKEYGGFLGGGKRPGGTVMKPMQAIGAKSLGGSAVPQLATPGGFGSPQVSGLPMGIGSLPDGSVIDLATGMPARIMYNGMPASGF